MNDNKLNELKKNYEFGTKQSKVLWLIDMINPVWCYSTNDREVAKKSKYITKYWDKPDALLTRAEVEEIVDKQYDYLKSAYTVYAGEDGEGVSYNSIVWDEGAKETININDYK